MNSELQNQEKINSMSEKVKTLTNEKISMQKVIMEYETTHVERSACADSMSKELEYVKPYMIEFKDNLD